MLENTGTNLKLRNPLKDFYIHSHVDSQADYDPLTDPRTDDWYYNEIKQYENDPMYSELLSNPWTRKNNAEFSPNLLQSFGELFGDTSARDNYYSQLLQQRNQVLKDWLAQRNQREFDTPSAQAERMALAGQNADLLGTGGVASAPENDQAFSLVDMPSSSGVGDAFQLTYQVAQTGISLVSSVMQFAQGVQSLKYGNAQLIAQELNNGKSAMGFLNDEMINTLGVSDITDIDKIDSAAYVRTLDDILSDKSLSRGTRNILKRYRNTLQGDSGTGLLHTMKMELAQRYQNARKGTATTISDPLYDKDFEKWIANLSDYFNEYVMQAQKFAIDAEKAQNKYTKEYYKGLDASKASEYENTAYDANKVAAENTKMVDELYNKIYNFMSKDDHWYSKLGLAFLPALRAYIMNMSIPSLNFSRPTTVNNIDNRRSQNVEGDFFNHFNN